MSIQSSSHKDYITTIYHLSKLEDSKGNQNGPTLVRIKDIANRLGVAPPSVVEYVQRLKDAGIVTVYPRKGVTLTKEGVEEAKVLLNRHRIMACFLQNILHIDQDTSNAQSHTIEHLLEPQVVKNLYNFINKEIGCPNKNCNFEEICTPE